ncbi:Superoxide dismutase [Mn], mitochondrial [Capsicum chinense]|nr:Superoxide dismutase [Mn], mitochondrial [Capsicum chinense]
MALRNLMTKNPFAGIPRFRQQLRCLQTFFLPDLPYDYRALEPAISVFWKNLALTREGGGETLKGSLGYAINTNFGSLEAVIQRMNAEGAALQGSGWVWLGLDKELKCLIIETTANQDPLVIKGPNLVPLLGIDVWEHAYYLQYKNVKPDYRKNI